MCQKKITTKNIIALIMVLSWMAVIYINSSFTADVSLSKTHSIITIIEDSICAIQGRELSSEAKDFLRNDFIPIIRKFAHFIQFFILFFLVFYFLSSLTTRNKAIIYSLIWCIAYAFFDEFHQLFVEGRVASLTDVLIDSLGSLTGAFIVFVFKGVKHEQKN